MSLDSSNKVGQGFGKTVICTEMRSNLSIALAARCAWLHSHESKDRFTEVNQAETSICTFLCICKVQDLQVSFLVYKMRYPVSSVVRSVPHANASKTVCPVRRRGEGNNSCKFRGHFCCNNGISPSCFVRCFLLQVIALQRPHAL